MPEIDKFVLTYQADTKDAEANVEKLEEKIEKLNASEKLRFEIEVEVEKAQDKVKELEKRLKDLPSEERIPVKVELKDARENLEKLEKKLKAVNKDAAKGADALKDKYKKFGSAAGEAVSQLSPEISGAVKAVGELTAEFGTAAMAAVALGLAIKGAMNVRERLTENMKTGQKLGVSPVYAEEWRRVANVHGGGMVNDKEFVEQLSGLRSKVSEAVTDVTGYGDAARAFRKGLGLSPRTLMGMRTSDQVAAISEAFQKRSREGGFKGTYTAQAVGRYLGLDPNTIKLMTQRGSSLGKISQMSSGDVQQYLNTQDKVKAMNDSLGKLKEAFDELEQAIAPRLIDILTEFTKAITDLVQLVTRKTGVSQFDTVADKKQWLLQQQFEKLDAVQKQAVQRGIRGGKDTMLSRAGGFIAQHLGFTSEEKQQAQRDASKSKEVQEYYKLLDSTNEAAARQVDALKGFDKITGTGSEAAKGQAAAAALDQATATKMAHDADEGNEAERTNQDKFARAMNMFVGAVASFANAIDDQQAIAAWAGEVGAASGLGGPTAASQGAIPSEAPTNAPISASVAKAAKAETASIPSSSSVKAQQAASETNGMIDRIAVHGNKLVKLIYGGGIKQDSSLPISKNNAPAEYSGQTRQNMQLRDVFANIASRTGLPLQQVMSGQINRDDVEFSVMQRERELQNSITANSIQLAKAQGTGMIPSLQTRKIERQIMEATRGLELMRQWGPTAISRAREGGRQYTLGERAVIVNLSGTFTDPSAAGDAAGKAIKAQLADLHNTSATMIKH